MISERLLKVLKNLEEYRQQEIVKEKAGILIPPIKRSLAITPDEGLFLFNILIAIKAKVVIEIGTSLGYSTIWLAAAMRENGGKVISFELIKEKAALAKQNLKKAGLTNYAEVINANAFEEIPKINLEVDLAFLDADKEDYINFFRILVPKLKKGGVLLSDNVLDCPQIHKKNPEICVEIMDYIKNLEGFSSLTLPFLPNGLEMTVKITD